MSLWRNSRRNEQAPESAPQLEQSADGQELADAIAAEFASQEAERASSARCTQLDEEWRSWSARRDSAFREFSTAAERHATAKAEVARLRKVVEFRSLVS